MQFIALLLLACWLGCQQLPTSPNELAVTDGEIRLKFAAPNKNAV
jgi:hypothetical protein